MIKLEINELKETINNNEILKKYIDNFKNSIKGPFEKHIKANTSIKESINQRNLSVFKDSLYQGYDDAKRTFKEISEVWDTYQDSKSYKDVLFDELAEKLCDLFSPNNSSTNFNDFHDNLCKYFIKSLSDKNYSLSTYGRAQKIINMALKYLYCLKDSNEYTSIFNECHMPLDSFTLEWCRRYLKDTRETLNSDTSWSGMKDELYYSLQDKIKDKLGYPLYAEFIIWPEIQKHIAAEEFIFTFKEYTKKDKKDFVENKNLSEKFDVIKKIINP